MKLLLGGIAAYVTIGVALEVYFHRKKAAFCADALAEAARQNARQPGSGGTVTCNTVPVSPTRILVWPIAHTPLAYLVPSSWV